MKNILLSIFLILILSACSVNSSQSKKTFIFEKKQECKKYENNYNNNDFLEINSIFYSEKYNTCFIAYIINDSSSWISLKIDNILEWKNHYRLLVNNSDDWNILAAKYNDFQNKIEQLKSE